MRFLVVLAHKKNSHTQVLNLDETVETTGVTSYRFTMEREDDEPAPWSPEAKQRNVFDFWRYSLSHVHFCRGDCRTRST